MTGLRVLCKTQLFLVGVDMSSGGWSQSSKVCNIKIKSQNFSFFVVNFDLRQKRFYPAKNLKPVRINFACSPYLYFFFVRSKYFISANQDSQNSCFTLTKLNPPLLRKNGKQELFINPFVVYQLFFEVGGLQLLLIVVLISLCLRSTASTCGNS